MSARTDWLAAAVLLLAAQAGAQEAEFSGVARVIDGDTIEVSGVIVRLADIDAPELGQSCEGPRALRPCGKRAADLLAERIEGATVECRASGLDAYGRTIASCSHLGGDLGAWLVTEGYAMAFVRYSTRFVDLEAEARDKGAGLWRAAFEPPWEFRAARWRNVDPPPTPDCPIKGNISRNNGDHIYHAPWSPYYERTRIDTSQGERWFCSEGEALAAGWRPPRR